MTLKAPFVWFGGKRKVAPQVWAALGDVDNYVEPFAGSLAVLLGRPHRLDDGRRRAETANDADHYLCVAPDTRLLAADLMWVTAKDVSVGDTLIGFDENNGAPQVGITRRPDRPTFQPPTQMRRWRPTTVTNVARRVAPCYRLTFEDGTAIVASEDHRWLTGRSGGGGATRWITTKGLRCDASSYASHVLKLCDVTKREESFDAGWVAGFFDGEGTIKGTGAGWSISVAQRLGPEMDRCEALLKERGFVTTRSHTRRPEHHSPVDSLLVLGGMREILRFLMTFRPERLMATSLRRLECRSIYGRQRQVIRLIKKEPLGDMEVVSIETTTRTFIAEGLASHNCNFWRAVAADPDAVAHYADWPVNEDDLFARHLWLVNEGREMLAAGIEASPEFFDARIAGWWVWGVNAWIGSGWCSGEGPWRLGDAGRGVNRQLPHLGSAGQGVNRNLPHLGNADMKGYNPAEHRDSGIAAYMHQLAVRLRHVRVCTGDWQRVVTLGALAYGATVGVFLDPPYSGEVRTKDLYVSDDHTVAVAAREWALANGDNPRYRIILAGYHAEHDAAIPATWRRVRWTASAAYQTSTSVGGNRDNRRNETLWLSPHCRHDTPTLFDLAPDDPPRPVETVDASREAL